MLFYNNGVRQNVYDREFRFCKSSYKS